MKQRQLNQTNRIGLEKGQPMKQRNGTILQRVDFNWTIKLEKGNEDMNWKIENISETHSSVRQMPLNKLIASALTDLTNAGDERAIFIYKPDGEKVAVQAISWAKRITCGHCGETKFADYNGIVIDGKDICPKCFYENPSLIEGKWKTQAVVQPHRKPIVRYSSTPEGTLKDAKVIMERGFEVGLWIEPTIYEPDSNKPVSVFD